MANESNRGDDRIARALGRIPSGCAILTASASGKRTGMLASWFQQSGFDPPMVSVAVHKGRPVEQLIDASGAFVLNLLPQDPTAMFKHFGRGFSLEEDAFSGLQTSQVSCGIALTQTLAQISARVHGKHDSGDHWVYVARVTEAQIEEVAQPYVHLRKNGMNY